MDRDIDDAALKSRSWMLVSQAEVGVESVCIAVKWVIMTTKGCVLRAPMEGMSIDNLGGLCASQLHIDGSTDRLGA